MLLLDHHINQVSITQEQHLIMKPHHNHMSFSEDELEIISKNEQLISIKGGCTDPNPHNLPKTLKDILEDLLHFNRLCTIVH